MCQRQTIHDAVAQLSTLDDDMPDSVFLVGWVLIAEFADPDGGRWFVTRTGTDGGETDLTAWAAKGYIEHARDEGLFDPVEPDDE